MKAFLKEREKKEKTAPMQHMTAVDGESDGDGDRGHLAPSRIVRVSLISPNPSPNGPLRLHEPVSVRYQRPKGSVSRVAFSVTHYAGQVTYHVAGFLKKNKDELYPDLLNILAASSKPHIRCLFMPEGAAGAAGGASHGPCGGDLLHSCFSFCFHPLLGLMEPVSSAKRSPVPSSSHFFRRPLVSFLLSPLLVRACYTPPFPLFLSNLFLPLPPLLCDE